MIVLPRVKSAFCGCTAEEGAKIISYIHVIGYGLLFLNAVYYSFQYETDPEKSNSDDLFTNMTEIINKTDEENEMDAYYNERRAIDEGFLALTSSFFNELVFLIQLVFAISLLLGIYKKNLDLMFSWVILQITHVFFSQALVTIYIYGIFSNSAHSMMFYLIFEELTLGIIEAYFIVIVHSYLKEITEIIDSNQEALSPIVISSSTVDLTYPEETNNFVHM